MTLPPPRPHRGGRLDALTEEQCWQLLDTTTVGRLAFIDDGGITILPVNFLVFEERVYVRTEPGSSVSVLAESRDDVAFEVDHHDDLNQSGWSVLVRGVTAEAETGDAERALASTTRLGPWAPGDRSLVVTLTPRAISGRRVSLR